MLKSKKGFTLVELTIVLAVTAIVVTMACSFMIAYRHQSAKIIKSSTAISEVNHFKDIVNQWLDENDDGATAFDVSSKKIEIGGNSLKFDSGGLTVNDGSPVKFSTLTDCKFSKKDSIENVIYCEVTAEIGNWKKKIPLVFNVHYGVSRELS